MQVPPLPDNETLRLQSLKNSGILEIGDTQPFQRLTVLARRCLNVSIAIISVVDSDRQWFKSCQGLDVTGTERRVSFCAHAILESRIFEVSDTHLDTRFTDNPLVTGPPFIRFYAGCPIRSPDGYRLGTLCVIDHSPRTLTPEERESLTMAALSVEDLLRSHASDTREAKTRRALDQQTFMGAIITEAQSRQIREANFEKTFRQLVAAIIDFTQSSRGYIGLLRRDEVSGRLSIRTFGEPIEGQEGSDLNAMNNDDDSLLADIFARVLAGNQSALLHRESERGLTTTLGIPLHVREVLTATLVLISDQDNYAGLDIESLNPLLITITQLLEAEQNQRRHRAAQRELAKLSRVARGTTNGVIITDSAGRIEWLNEGFTRISGYTIEEVRGKKPGQLLQGKDSDPQTLRTMNNAITEQRSFEVELINYHKSGRPYWIHINCDPLFTDDGELQGFMAIESDVTERKHLEQIKEQFVSVVSHELRTPLTAIRGALALAETEIAETGSTLVQEMLDISYKNSLQLSKLVDDLLDTSALLHGRLRLEYTRVDVMSVIQQVVSNLRPHAKGSGVRLRLRQEHSVSAHLDGNRLSQILSNMISNAIKYSPENEDVDIFLKPGSTAARFRVEVHDRGPGIPQEFHSQVFERFAQADTSDSRSKSGTGLGLAISRDLVEQMQGRIDFTTTHQGTCFFVELPNAIHQGREDKKS